MRKLILVLVVWCGVVSSAPPGLEQSLPTLDMCVNAYRAIFHKISPSQGSINKTRKELRVAVTSAQAEGFFADAKKILGDDARTGEGQEKRLQLRDKPEDPGTMFITDSDYLPTFKGMETDGTESHKARIRIRSYWIVPVGTSVAEAKKYPSKYGRAKIADGDGVFVKLEFKVGKPSEETETTISRDIEGVVEKPSLTLLESDVDLLLKDVESFKANLKMVSGRAKEVKLTSKDGTSVVVNDPKEVDAMFARIGVLHEQGWEAKKLHPQTNMSYVREAFRVFFQTKDGKVLEVQITLDRDIHQTYIRSGVEEKYAPDDRVIELKIPEFYADMSTETLTKEGLGELAELKEKYLALTPLEGTKRDGGKPRNLGRRNRPAAPKK